MSADSREGDEEASGRDQHPGETSGRVEDRGALLRTTVEDGLIVLAHRRNAKVTEDSPHQFTEEPLTSHFLPRGAKQGAAPLKNLIDQKCKHYQPGKIDRQMLLAVSLVMLEVVSRWTSACNHVTVASPGVIA